MHTYFISEVPKSGDDLGFYTSTRRDLPLFWLVTYNWKHAHYLVKHYVMFRLFRNVGEQRVEDSKAAVQLSDK